MSLLLIGVNHQTASLDLREELTLAPARRDAALAELLALDEVRGACLLYTCNRSELCLDSQASPERTAALALDWVAGFHRIGAERLGDVHYRFEGEAVLEHLARVGAGLDSQVLGEPEILGQLRQAVAAARAGGALSPELRHALEFAVRAARRVRAETAIGENPVSLVSLAVSLLPRIFDSPADTRLLLVGAGATIRSAALHLRDRGLGGGGVLVANRTPAHARTIAALCGGEAISLTDLPERLAEADVVISSTASELPVLGKGAVEAALRRRRHRPMLLIDLAVPRDIELGVGQLPDAYLYGLEDLHDNLDESLLARRRAAADAEGIIEVMLREHRRARAERQTDEALRQLRHDADVLRAGVLARAKRDLARGADPTQVVERLARDLTNKMLHGPSVELRAAGARGRAELLESIRGLYGPGAADSHESSRAGAAGSSDVDDSSGPDGGN